VKYSNYTEVFSAENGVQVCQRLLAYTRILPGVELAFFDQETGRQHSIILVTINDLIHIVTLNLTL
jgi:hypothetical protein